MSEIDSIVKDIIHYSQQYYDGNSTITDSQFDKLVEQLRALDSNHPILKTVGWGYKTVGDNKANHKVIIGSLAKVRINEVTNDMFVKYPIATPKIDGGSAVAYYENGYLRSIISRGDGREGIDITPNLIHSVPVRLMGFDDSIAVRGEIVLTLEDFKDVGGSSPRNRAVGLSQSKYSDVNVKKLRFIAYSIVWISNGYPEHMLRKDIQLNTIENFGFEIPNAMCPKSNKDLYDIHHDLSLLSDGKTILTDGIVLSAVSSNLFDKEYGKEIVNDSIAVKFEEESAISEIESIRWVANRTGRIVPIASIKTVKLSGANISNVTCYNYGFVSSNKLGKGAIVELVRANEVIPKIIRTVKTSDNMDTPKDCPICNTTLQLTETGLDLICQNMDCQAKLDNVIFRAFETVKPDGIGEVTLNELAEVIRPKNNNYSFKEVIDNISLFIGRYSQGPDSEHILQDMFGNHIGSLIFEMLLKFVDYKPKISEIMYISSIPAIGDTTVEKMNEIAPSKFIDMIAENNFSTVSNLFRTSISYENIHKYNERIRLVILMFGTICDARVPIIVGDKWKVAVTGKLSKTRDEWYKDHPNLIASGISKDTKFLVTNESSDSSKYQGAVALNVRILTEYDFEKIYREKFGIMGGDNAR